MEETTMGHSPTQATADEAAAGLPPLDVAADDPDDDEPLGPAPSEVGAVWEVAIEDWPHTEARQLHDGWEPIQIIDGPNGLRLVGKRRVG